MKVIVGIDITAFNAKKVHFPYIEANERRYLGIELIGSSSRLDYSKINASKGYRLYRAWKLKTIPLLTTMAQAGDKTAFALVSKLTTTDERILIA